MTSKRSGATGVAAATGASRRILVIFNPAAGWRRRPKVERAVKSLRARGASVEVVATAGPGDAGRIAAAAAAERYDAIAIAGGDGTINEAVNGLIAVAPERRPPLGIIPVGTANVLAHDLVSADMEPALEVLIRGEPLVVHPGCANGRRFMMMAGVGFDARCVRRVDPALKRLISKGAYVWAGIAEICTDTRPFYRVLVDGTEHQVGSAIVARGRHYAGGYVCAKRARLDRAAFEVCLLSGNRRLDIVRYAAAIAAGAIEGSAGAAFVAARALRVEGPSGEPVQADGDIVATLPVDLTIDTDAIRLLHAPAAMAE